MLRRRGAWRRARVPVSFCTIPCPEHDAFLTFSWGSVEWAVVYQARVIFRPRPSLHARLISRPARILGKSAQNPADDSSPRALLSAEFA